MIDSAEDKIKTIDLSIFLNFVYSKQSNAHSSTGVCQTLSFTG